MHGGAMGGSVMCVFGRRFMAKNMCLHENILYHFIRMGMRLVLPVSFPYH